jgi:hypothetical protein
MGHRGGRVRANACADATLHVVLQAFVKVGGMVNSHPDFINHPKVMNGMVWDRDLPSLNHEEMAEGGRAHLAKEVSAITDFDWPASL